MLTTLSVANEVILKEKLNFRKKMFNCKTSPPSILQMLNIHFAKYS